MKIEKLKTRLKHIGFAEDKDRKVWNNRAGLTVSFPTVDTVKVEAGVNATLWRLPDITIKDGYVNAKKSKTECLKYNRCGGGECDMCLAYEFQKAERKKVKKEEKDGRIQER